MSSGRTRSSQRCRHVDADAERRELVVDDRANRLVNVHERGRIGDALVNALRGTLDVPTADAIAGRHIGREVGREMARPQDRPLRLAEGRKSTMRVPRESIRPAGETPCAIVIARGPAK